MFIVADLASVMGLFFSMYFLYFQMASVCWVFYISKFIELFDTVSKLTLCMLDNFAFFFVICIFAS